MARAAEVDGHAQQAARPRDPIRAPAQAVVALRLNSLARSWDGSFEERQQE